MASLYSRARVLNPSVHTKHIQLRTFLFRSKEERSVRREQIWSEIKQGYFHELNEFRKIKGKRFEALDHLCSQKEAVMFPRISGRSLSGHNIVLPEVHRDHVTLVLMSMRAIGMKMCEEYRRPFQNKFQNNVNITTYEVAVVDQIIFKFMRYFLERNLRHQVAESNHTHFLCYTGKFSEVRKTLSIHNSIIGYVFLLDSKGLIRWRAHGYPNEREINALLKCTCQLFNN